MVQRKRVWRRGKEEEEEEEEDGLFKADAVRRRLC